MASWDVMPMALSLSTQLENLERERQRLEELLMLDANWRELRRLDELPASGDAYGDEHRRLRAELEHALKANRIFVARAKLIETIELLSSPNGALAGTEGGRLASRIVMLSEPTGERFRARLRMKPAEAGETAAEASVPPVAGGPATSAASQVPPDAPAEKADQPSQNSAMPDALMLVGGLSLRAVELLQEGGVTRFAQIAGWSSVETAAWRSRLKGVADGSTGAWIEQAAILARGQPTQFSQRLRRGEYAALVPVPEAEPARPVERFEPFVTTAAPQATFGPAVDPLPVAPKQATATEVSTVPRRRLKTAEEIAVALASREVAAPVDGGKEGAVQADKLPAPIPKRGPYSRSQPRMARFSADELSSGGDVTVVIKEVTEKRSLVGRLKDVSEPQRFEAGTYAAYRGTVEEASVTILRSEPPVAAQPAGGAADAVSAPAPAKSSRFLKALTGKS